MCLYIVLIATLDVDRWGYYIENDTTKLLFVGFVVTAFFADTGLFLLASVAFILTLVRLESSKVKADADSERFADTFSSDRDAPKGFEYVSAESNREQKESFKGNVNASLPSQPTLTPSTTTAEPSPSTPIAPPTPTAPTATTTVTPTPTITPSTLVSREKTTDVTGKTFDDPAQQALQKYAIETSLEKASSDGIIKSNYNKFMYPLGQQYNVQGITETIVGYNYDQLP